MKITPSAGAILSALHLNSDRPATEVAKATRNKTHVVHYVIRKAREEGIIRSEPLVNFFSLGLHEFQVFFSLAAHHPRKSIIEFLQRNPAVLWIGELGGSFSYGFTLLVKGPQDSAQFLREFTMKFGACYDRISQSHLLSFHLLRKSYLSPGYLRSKDDVVSLLYPSTTVIIDEMDWKIIASLHDSRAESQRDLSRIIGAPRSTVDARLKSLRERGVLSGNVLRIRASKLGRQVYKILIQTRGMTSALRRLVFDFAIKESSVVSYAESLGAWDLQLVLEASESSEVVEMRERLLEKLRQHCAMIEVVQVFNQMTSPKFLQFDLK
jgi:DNA-binding Lrp family transcriptional regulator